MTDISTSNGFVTSLKADPENPDNYSLTIEFSAEQLAEFLAPHIGPLNLKKVAKAKHQTSEAKRKRNIEKDREEARKAHLVTGKAVHESQAEFKVSGLENEEAWVRAAKEFDLSLFDARIFARLYRVELNKKREERLIQLYRSKKSNRQIAKSLRINKNTVSHTIGKLRKAGQL